MRLTSAGLLFRSSKVILFFMSMSRRFLCGRWTVDKVPGIRAGAALLWWPQFAYWSSMIPRALPPPWRPRPPKHRVGRVPLCRRWLDGGHVTQDWSAIIQQRGGNIPPQPAAACQGLMGAVVDKYHDINRYLCIKMTKSAEFIVQVSCRWTQTTATHSDATAARGGCSSATRPD